MTLLHVDMYLHQEYSFRRIQGLLRTQAEVAKLLGRDGSHIGKPRHHGSREIPCGSHAISADLPDCNDAILDWWKAVNESSTGLDLTPTTPRQSPTTVTCTHSVTEQVDPKLTFTSEPSTSVETTSNTNGGNVPVTHDLSGDADKLRALLDAWLLADSVPEVSVHKNATSDDSVYKETQRLRQRRYERAYKKRKQAVLHTTRLEWLKHEAVLYHCLQKKARPFTVNRRATLQERYHEKLLETRELQRDIMVLETARFWKKMFALRNYTITEEELAKGRIPEDEEDTEEDILGKKPADPEVVEANWCPAAKQVVREIPEEILRTKERWAAIDRKILDASVAKPFQPLQFEFKW